MFNTSKQNLAAAPLIALVVGGLAVTGCGRAVTIDLSLVEACDQKSQALNGVSSYVLSSAGGDEQLDPVAFNIDQGPSSLTVPLGNVIVSVDAFADDVSVEGAASAAPQALGRTMPLAITESTPDISAMVLMGKTGTFARTTGADGVCSAMTADAPVKGRHGHTATFVPVLNQVLVVGGATWVEGEERLLNTAELWDPATGLFTPLGNITARAYHAATATPDGKVLITGGFGVVGGQITTLITGLLFDPETKDFKTIQLRQARAHHTSTLMTGVGLIALVGGCVGSDPADGCSPTAAGEGPQGSSTNLGVSVETFDITQDIATQAVTTGLAVGRAFHQASVIGEGAAQVLVVTGGGNASGPACDLEFFRLEGSGLVRVDSANAVGFPAGRCPVRHAAVSLDAARILVTGGQTQMPGGLPSGPGTNEAFFVSAQGVDAASAFTTLIGRHGHVSAKSTDGSVLVIGGVIADVNPVAERIAAPAGGGALAATPVQGLQAARDHAALTVLPTNQVFYSGGHTTTQPLTTQASAEIFFGR